MKRLILIITALVLTVMLASCGSGGSSGADADTLAEITVNPEDTRQIEYDYYNDGSVRTLKYKDDNGNEVEKVSYTSTGVVTDRTVTTYDGTRLVKVEFYLGESELNTTTEYSYNDDGSENDIIRRRADGYVQNYCTYEYDDDGAVTICDRYWSETEKYCEDYSYSADGTLVSSGRREYRVTDGVYYEYLFDNEHNITGTLTYDTDPMPQPAE